MTTKTLEQRAQELLDEISSERDEWTRNHRSAKIAKLAREHADLALREMFRVQQEYTDRFDVYLRFEPSFISTRVGFTPVRSLSSKEEAQTQIDNAIAAALSAAEKGEP